MAPLHALIAEKVTAWKEAGYPCEAFPVISEILDYQTTQSDPGVPVESRYLRGAQIQALTTYWYLRLVEGTPAMLDLYKKRILPSQTSARL